MHAPQPELDLVFFDPDLRLVSELDEAAVAAHPRRRLARQILLLPSPSFRRVMAGLVVASARLQRACALVRDLSRPGGNRDAEALRLLDEEWLFCARSRRIRRLLRRQATALGLAAPDALAIEVLAAVRDELIPGVHLRTYLASTKRSAERVDSVAAARQVHWLSAWTFARKPWGGGVYVYSCWLQALAHNQAEPPESIALNLKRLTAAGFAAKRLVQDGLCAQLRELVRTKLTGRVALGWIDRQLWLLAEFERSAPPHLGLLTLQSLFHLLAGLRMLDSGNAAAALPHLAKAVLYDPHNAQAQNRLHQVENKFSMMKPHLPDGEANLDKAFHAAVLKMKDFQTSAEAQRIADRRQRGLLIELGCRLGLPISEHPQSLEELADLLTMLDRLAGSAVEQSQACGQPFAAVFRTQVLAERPDLAALPWPLIVQALQGGPPAAAEQLLDALPRQSPTNWAALLSSLPDPEPTQPRDDSLVRIRHLLTWAASLRDLGFKLAGVCGLAMLVSTGVDAISAGIRRAERDLMYRRVLAGVRDNKDDDVITSGAGFLERTPQTRNDPRMSQVAGFVDSALLRQVVAKAKAGRETEAGALLRLWSRLSHREPTETTAEASVTEGDFAELADEDEQVSQAAAQPEEQSP